jgi:hypothetical protein
MGTDGAVLGGLVLGNADEAADDDRGVEDGTLKERSGANERVGGPELGDFNKGIGG